MPTVLKSGNLKLLELSGLVQACNGISIPFYDNLQTHWAQFPVPGCTVPLSTANKPDKDKIVSGLTATPRYVSTQINGGIRPFILNLNTRWNWPRVKPSKRKLKKFIARPFVLTLRSTKAVIPYTCLCFWGKIFYTSFQVPS